MLTFGTFGAGFLMRPLGAVILGSYIDRIGRRNGFTPMMSTWLIEKTGDKASPGYWMMLAAVRGLVATFLLYSGIVKQNNRTAIPAPET